MTKLQRGESRLDGIRRGSNAVNRNVPDKQMHSKGLSRAEKESKKKAVVVEGDLKGSLSSHASRHPREGEGVWKGAANK
ncbi:uncharacterized protein CCOS01_12903 [Colletotrichum costaricense]|uniref:Uncharacterized protein n=1 Tax=Colletotrichum costaricense TaxID=1209916 RepID=A0AAI9YM56_9PEZI|nr:uncharacterized protein CCOS01_12903 [Colletotrichum costaricense]KAK1515705.1 hypothetical protein CCOS01_12903 [Colletotrichum costaricense]